MADHDEADLTPSDAGAASSSAGGSGAAEPLESDQVNLEGSSVTREPATVGARTGSSVRPRGAPIASKPKGTPTARRDRTPERERTTPPKFVRQSIGELRKVVYPSGSQLGNYFVVVLVFVLFIIAFVSLLDLGLGQIVFKVFS